MAVTEGKGNFVRHTAAADESTGRYFVKTVLWTGAASAGQFQMKDVAGNIIIPTITLAGTAVTSLLVIPLHKMVNGIETDILSSGEATYLL